MQQPPSPSSVPPPPSSPRAPPAPSALSRYILRFALSAPEYQTLHSHSVQHLPRALVARAPAPTDYASLVASSRGRLSEPTAAAVRASLRVLALLYGGLSTYDGLKAALARRRDRMPAAAAHAGALARAANLRLASAAALFLLLHRLLHRFLRRLRAQLRHPGAAPFRRRNPYAARVLTARLAPAVGAGLGGAALALCPCRQLRLKLAIYAATRAAECAYDAPDAEGRLPRRPRWWGSWLLMPPVFGQLLHAFLFDRDCFPEAYGDFILKYTPNYVQRRPQDYPAHLPWPGTKEIVESLADVSRLRYPPFVSPILFPNVKETLPAAVAGVAPVTSTAHPSITHLSCAMLHPQEPSCLRSYITFYLKAFPNFAKFFGLLFAVFAIPNYRAYLKDPLNQLNRLTQSVLRMTMFATGAIGTSWASICLFQSLFPRKFLPTQRWFWGGFLGGLWGLLERERGRSQFLYSFRISVDSLWKVGVKRGWWRGRRAGDILVVITSLMVLNVVHELRPDDINSGMTRRAISFAKGESRKTKPSGVAEEDKAK